MARHGPVTQQRAMQRSFDLGVVHELTGRHGLGLQVRWHQSYNRRLRTTAQFWTQQGSHAELVRPASHRLVAFDGRGNALEGPPAAGCEALACTLCHPVTARRSLDNGRYRRKLPTFRGERPTRPCRVRRRFRRSTVARGDALRLDLACLGGAVAHHLRAREPSVRGRFGGDGETQIRTGDTTIFSWSRESAAKRRSAGFLLVAGARDVEAVCRRFPPLLSPAAPRVTSWTSPDDAESDEELIVRRRGH